VAMVEEEEYKRDRIKNQFLVPKSGPDGRAHVLNNSAGNPS
jgi:hypothetical protein